MADQVIDQRLSRRRAFFADGIDDPALGRHGQRAFEHLDQRASVQVLLAGELHQRGDADDLHDPFEIVGEDVQGHLSADMFQRLHLEVGIAHPAFEGAKGMFDGFPSLPHKLGMFIEPALHFF